jgi:hypothetical protein
MYKNFNITESEKEEILNRLKENGYGQPINEQKTQTSQVVPTNALAIAKEVLQNIIAGKHLFPLKTLPGYVGAHITNEPGIPYEQKKSSYGEIRRTVKINVFKVGNGVVNVILKDLQIGDGSVSQYNAKDETAANLASTDCPDAASYLQYLNTTPPNGKLTKLNMTLENGPFPDFELWRLTHYCVAAGVSVKEMLDILKQFNPNIGNDILNNWSYNNVFYNSTRGWDESDRKIYYQVKALVDQPESPQGQKPVTPQTKKPINEQNVPPKPVATKQKSVDNVAPKGQHYTGKPDPKLIQQLNMVKEIANIINGNLNNGTDKIQIVVPKTIKDAGVMILKGKNYDLGGNFKSGNGSVNNCWLKFDLFKINGAFTQKIYGTIELTANEGGSVGTPENPTSIVSALCDSQNLQEFIQNLNKYPAEVYARQEFLYNQKELRIELYFQNDNPMNTSSLFDMFTYSQDGSKEKKLDFIKQIEAVYPNFKDSVIAGYDERIYEVYKNRDQDKNYVGTQKSVGMEKDEFLKLYNQAPTPVQGQQPAAPQPTAKKPLNEGQEILIDVFKSLIK